MKWWGDDEMEDAKGNGEANWQPQAGEGSGAGEVSDSEEQCQQGDRVGPDCYQHGSVM